jgi:hypothetical protein
LPLHVDISAANLNDHRMLEDMVDGVRPVRRPVGRPRKRPGKLHGDKGYDYPECRDLLRSRNITPRIARKGIESSSRLGRHRYVIERCLDGQGLSGVDDANVDPLLGTTSAPRQETRRCTRSDSDAGRVADRLAGRRGYAITGSAATGSATAIRGPAPPGLKTLCHLELLSGKVVR